MHKLINSIAILACIITFSSNAQALEINLDHWAELQIHRLTLNCAARNSKEWLASYLQVETQVELKLGSGSDAIFEGVAPVGSFADFVEVFYPQALPETVDLAGAFLPCFVAFTDFAEGKTLAVRKTKLLQWGTCMKHQKSTSSLELDLAKCVLQLKVK